MKNIKILTASIFIALFIGGCSVKNSTQVPTHAQYGQTDESKVLSNANKFTYSEDILSLIELIDKHTGKRTGGDCSGFISFLNNTNNYIFYNNQELPKYFTKNSGKSNALYNLYKTKGKIAFESPKKGDLIFFANTTKSTKKRKTQTITHIGVIRDIYEDGRISFVHNTRGRNRVDYMNLNKKNTNAIGKKIENSFIVRCKNSDTTCLASNRFVGYGKVGR